MSDRGIAIIGAGFAGLAAGHALATAGISATIFEARPYWGGHTHSETLDGFTFDEGPHISFTKDPKVIELFRDGAGDVNEFRAKLTNYRQGAWIRHPAQVHLYGLDAELVTRSIVDLAAARERPGPVKTYEDWCYNAFGRTFAEQFPFVYTRKFWTVEASELTTDWVEKRMYAPTLAEIVKGAITPAVDGEFHYFSTVRYPREGGYQSFMRALVDESRIVLGKEVTTLDLRSRRVVFRDGSEAAFQQLISTMPLPDLVAAIPHEQVPSEVRRAAEQLLCTSLVLVDMAVDRPDLSDNHLFYVYDEDISFARAHFPHMLSATNAPDGRGSVQLEIYHSPRRRLPCSPSSLPERTIAELVRIGVLATAAEVLWARHREVPYANVVFDHARASALQTIVPWLEGRGVLLAGRYGEWGYHWTDDAVRSGWTVAAKCARIPA